MIDVFHINSVTSKNGAYRDSNSDCLSRVRLSVYRGNLDRITTVEFIKFDISRTSPKF